MRRVPVALALAAALVAPTAAEASCTVVTDAAGDADGSIPFVDPFSDPALDILSGSFSSDADELTAVIDVTDLAGSPLTTAGSRYWFAFTVEEGSNPRFYFEVDVPAAGPATATVNLTDHPDLEFAGHPIGPADVVLDQANDEVRISADLAEFQDYVPMADGSAVLNPYAHSRTENFGIDHAMSNGSYPLGSTGCG